MTNKTPFKPLNNLRRTKLYKERLTTKTKEEELKEEIEDIAKNEKFDYDTKVRLTNELKMELIGFQQGYTLAIEDVLKKIDERLNRLNKHFVRYDKECLKNVRINQEQYKYSERQRAKTLYSIDELEELKSSLKNSHSNQHQSSKVIGSNKKELKAK